MPLPLLGRLHAYVLRAKGLTSNAATLTAQSSTEYLALFASFFLVSLEAIIRVSTLALRE